ncbi:hypothetical protein BDN70DRAFT_872126 [Pholiota conissans]|uniref:F-box domain-containing protein n=1 Tax=Pholiota conissans TaxID=109636 RepID=A0A9P5ZEA2_9AGAR|nr:hypothetical protein BDN70DRAFT_872126 [Pholiota conissans]
MVDRRKSQQLRLDWTPLVSALKRNERYLLHAVDHGRAILRLLMWKHHFSPIDTSNAVTWLNTAANLIPPSKPVINGMPHDILARIFSFVVHSDCTTPKDRCWKEILHSSVTSGSSPTTPLILGHVCTSWRSFVHHTPSLWSTIAVQGPLPKHVEVVSFWLARSEKCPLDLRLEQFLWPDPSSYAIAELFVAQAHRWRRISFVLGIEAPFAKMRAGDTPLLEEFRIRLDKWNRTKAHAFIEVLQSSPALHTINWGKSIYGRVPAETPWCQLSNISLQNLELSEPVVNGLSLCTALKVLHLRFMRKATDHNLVITLPYLERLVCERTESYPCMFDSFTLPSLHDLHWVVAFSAADKGAQLGSLINMVDRSGCTLKTVTVNRNTFDLVSTRLSAGVIALHLFDGATNSDLLELIRHPGQCIMPKLQHLFLETCFADDGVLSTVLLSRSPDLKTFRVCLDRSRYINDIITLGWLKKDGMTVDIQEPFCQTQVVSCSVSTADPDPESDVITTLRFPDMETLWT